MHRLDLLQILVALVVAPFGHMASAEAMAPVQHMSMGMAEHCAEMPAPAPTRSDPAHKATIDCQAACAVVATLEGPTLVPAPAATSVLAGAALPQFLGLHPEAEPPPPRVS